MITLSKGIMCIAALTLPAFVCHAAIAAASGDGSSTASTVSVDARSDDTASIPDFDGDGTIGFGDFVKFAAKFGLGQGDDGYDAQYDLNDDGEIGFTDLVLFAENFGKDAPASLGDDGGEAGRRDWGYVVLHSFRVSDVSLTAGQAFTLETTVQKRRADGLSVPIRYLRSLDDTIDTSDALIHWDLGTVVDTETTAIQTLSLDWTAPSYAGTYYYGVCEGQALDFSHCSNGVRVIVEGSEDGTPNLAVLTPHVSHTSVSPRSRITKVSRIENIGTGTAAGTSLRVYLSDDATIDTTDSLFSIFAVPIRKTEEAHIYIATFWTPSVEGTYYVGICVDPVPGETDIANNCSVGVPLIIESGGGGSPDLIVRLPIFETPNRTTETLRIGSEIINLGSRASAETVVRLYRTTDATVDATDTPIGTFNIRSIDTEHSNFAWFDPEVPSSRATYHFTACVDPVPGESNTDNNCSESMPINVGVPDLAVGLTWASTSVPMAEESFKLTATVRNHGTEASGPTTLRYYRSDDDIIDANDTPIGNGAVSSLTGFDGLVSGPGGRPAPSGRSRQAISVSAPSRPGTYYYGACADAVPNETNADNNCSAGAYVRVVPVGEDPFNIELVFIDEFTDAHEDLMQQAARRWETIITQGLPDVDFSTNEFVVLNDDGRVRTSVNDIVDDLRIFIVKADLEEGVLGQAGPVFVRSGNPTGLPALGQIWINPYWIAQFSAHEPLYREERWVHDLMLHETAHALGFGSSWRQLGLVHELTGDTYFSGEHAIEAFNAAGGEGYSRNKVPVESGHLGASCAAGLHWNPYVFRGFDREFGAELMEPSIAKEHALSAITVQSIADLGYVVDVSRADPYRLPASANTYPPPPATSKPVAVQNSFSGALGTIYVGDEHGNIIRTIEP